MAYRRMRRSKKAFRKKSRKAPTQRRRLVKLIKRVTTRVAEPKAKRNNIGKTELFHNVPVAQIINGSSYLPAQGVSDSQRVGDQIKLMGFNLRLLFGQKGDRPNVNFRWWIVKVPKGSTYSYANWFSNATGNVLLDDPNDDFVKVIKRGVMRPNQAGLTGTGDDEYTFSKTISFKYTKTLKFGPADAAVTHNDNDLYFVIAPYDAFGSLVTDNIAYYLGCCTVSYRDP